MITPPDEDFPPAPSAGEPADLGFGRVVSQQVRGRFLTHDGVPTSRKYGLGAQRTSRFFLEALNVSWPVFIAWLVGLLLLINGTFALAYIALGKGTLQGGQGAALDDAFLSALSFSVGVFTTVGTGSVYVTGATAHWLLVFESFLGPLVLLAAGGLVISRLTRPRMSIRFSESAVIAPYEGGRGFMFRMVNAQPGELSSVAARVNLALFEVVDGKRERNFYQLELERDSVEFFPLHWTVVHPITASSPLAGFTPDQLREAEAEFLILVSAHEDTFSTHVTARASYYWDEVRWDVKWASVFASTTDGVLAIDVERLDRTERLDEGTTSLPASIESDPHVERQKSI